MTAVAIIKQGASLKWEVRAHDVISVEKPLDLANVDIKFTIWADSLETGQPEIILERNSSTAEQTSLIQLDASNGTFELELTPAETATIPAKVSFYSSEFVFAIKNEEGEIVDVEKSTTIPILVEESPTI